MRSPEFSQRDNEISEEFLEKVHEKAKDIMEMNRVQIGDFERLYSKSKLEADAEYIERRKNNFEESTPEQHKAKKMAEVMEAMVIDPKLIRLWFGFSNDQGDKICEVNAMGTSELDDLANGVDAIWELKHINEGISHLALGVDVTFAADFENKIKAIKGNMDQGQLSKVEYFMPKWGDVKGEMTNIPQVVVGMDSNHFAEVAAMWSKMEDRKDELESHPLQRLILEQIMYQLPVYENYARKIGNDEIADKIAVTKGKFQKLYDMAKSKVEGYQDFIEDDKVLQRIKEYLKDFDELEGKTPSGKLRAEINAKHGI